MNPGDPVSICNFCPETADETRFGVTGRGGFL